MSDLLSLLSLGSGGLGAANSGAAVASNNVANANTVGYSRQRVDLEALQLGGVRAGDPQRLASNLLASRIRIAGGALAMARAFAEALSDVEVRLVGSGATVDEQLGTLFTRIGQTAAMPTDVNIRESVVAAARDLVAGIKRRAAEAEAARKESDARIGDTVAQAAALARDLAESNRQVAMTGDPAALDRREETAKQLASIVGGAARVDGDGQMRFVLDGGAVLVDGIRASQLVATPESTTGRLQVGVSDGTSVRDVTRDLAGGSIAGELQFRDGTMGQVAADMDQLAYDVATQFNNVHAANAGTDGVSGRNLFVPLTGVAGAASNLALDPDILADPTKLATAAAGTGPGNNAGALALFGLATSKVAKGGTRTLSDSALDIISKVALDSGTAQNEVERDELVSDHLAGLRDSLSGVDVSEELANLARFEHASAAMSKFVSTIDDMLGTLINQL